MYLDWQYFLRQGEDFVNKNPIKYERVTSGFSKGEYFAKLDIPKNVDFYQRNQHLLERYGYEDLPTYGSFSRTDKEEAKKEYAKELANYFSTKYKKESKQLFSDLYFYYQKNKFLRSEDIFFDGEIGRAAKDYFKILDGDINQNNWTDKFLYSDSTNAPVGTLTTFNELYFFKKEKAVAEWLNKNTQYSTGGINKRFIDSFKFDEENIPEIAQFEAKLKGKVQPESLKQSVPNNIDLIKSTNLSNISNTGNIKVGFRKDAFLSGNVFVGRKRVIVLENGEDRNGYFALVELSDVIASHNEVTFSTSQGYPTDANGKNVNDRNYAGDKNAQAKVVSVAQKLNPNIIISTNVTASGTPIITIDGIVVSGNNRIMSLKLAASKYKENFDVYVAKLKQELAFGGYGIPSEQTENFQMPILVRFDLGFPSYTSTELNVYNKPTAKSEKVIDKAIRLSKQIDENQNCKLALIDLVSEQEVVSELYNDRISVMRFAKILLNCNIINDNQVSEFFTDNSLTETGKILYETILISTVLSPSAIEISQKAGVKSATNSIVNAIIPLIKNQKFVDGSLITEVNNALLIQNDYVSSGFKGLAEFITQNTMFEEKVNYKTEKAFVINWFLNQKINFFKNSLLRYNNSVESNQGISLFGDSKTPEEIFDSVFKSQVDADVSKALMIYARQTQPEAIIEKQQSSELPTSKEPATAQESDIAKELLLLRLQKAKKYL